MVDYSEMDLQTLQQIRDEVLQAITDKQAVQASRPSLDPSPPVVALRIYLEGLMDDVQNGVNGDLRQLVFTRTLLTFYGASIFQWLKTFRNAQ